MVDALHRMLAFVMPVPMSYDIELTIFSLVVAIVVTGGGFYVISRRGASPLRLVLSGIFMGLGIVAMHYTGMRQCGPRRARLRPALRCALRRHRDRRIDGGAMAGLPNH